MNSIKNNKAIYLLLILLAFGCKSNSQQKVDKPINENEITWHPGIMDALAQAKKENKLLFVECYSPTCPYCQALEPFFKTPEVAIKYNSNFISYKMDVTKEGERKFLDDRSVWLPSFPMFLFFDGDGKLVHQAGADPTVESINGNADLALDPDKRASSYASRFAKGERNIDFLSNYAAYGRVTLDTMATLNAANELFKIYPKDKLGTEESWKILKKSVNDIDNGFSKYWFDHVKEAAAFEAKEGHPGNENNIFGGIIQSSIYSSRGKAYGVAKLQTVKEYMKKAGAGEYAESVTWELEVKANIRENQPAKALAIGEKTVSKFKGNGSAIVYITRVFIDSFKDNSYIPSAKKWLAEAATSINQDNVKAEYFYELARIHQKAGDSAEAKTNAQSALTLANKIGSKNTKFQELLNSLN